MKNLRLTWGLFALSAMLTFSACQQDDAVQPEMVMEFNAEEFLLQDIDALENVAVTGATETAAFTVSRTDEHKSDSHPLAGILTKLNLNDRQKKAVRGFVTEHAACTKEHHEKIKEVHQQILKHANAVREEYVQAYKAGRITKAELEQRLEVLRGKVREEIKTNEAKQMHLRMLRQCRATLFTNIESVLNREQLQIWERWKQSMRDAIQK